MLNYQHNSESFIHWVLLITPELQLAWKCGFVVERFRQSSYCCGVAGSNPTWDVLTRSKKVETADHVYLGICPPDSKHQNEKSNTGTWLLAACWAFKLVLQFVVRTNDKFSQKNLEYIALISPPMVIIDRYSIVARRSEYARGNSMHLFIKFLFESQASLNKRAAQLLAWLRIFVSARSKVWPVSTQCEAIRNAFTLQFLIADRCSLILVTTLLEVCPV